MKNLFILGEDEKNRILNLHESATKRHYLSEQVLDLGQQTPTSEPITGPQRLENTSGTIVKKGIGGDPYIYSKLEGKYYFAKASEGDTPNWRLATTEKGVNAIKSKVFDEKIPVVKTIKPPVKTIKTIEQPVNTTKTIPGKDKVKPKLNQTNKPKSSQNFCPTPPKTKDVDLSKMSQYQKVAGELISKEVPVRSACEISYVGIRPKFSNRNFFVVDTRHNNIYLFNKQGQFVGKSYIIDGLHAQSQDAKQIAMALWSWDESTKAAGFIWDGVTQKYKDKTTKGRVYNNDLIYDYMDKNKSRFFPKGIYSINALKTDKDYAGGKENLFKLSTLDGKNIALAIHGFYNEPPRVKAMQELKKAMGSSSSPTSESIPDNFINMVEQYLQTSKFNKSYGCINLPDDFLKIAKPYAVGALVFVIGENENNYLVQNDKFFKEMGGETQQCPNPESLGKILPKISDIA